MKILITIALLQALSLPAIAGLPSQDAEVARLQAEFTAAQTPSPATLRSGETWKCTTFNAVKDYSERYEGPTYHFVEAASPQGEKYFLEKEAYEMVQNHQVDASMIAFVYRFGAGHFMGNPYEDPSLTTVHTYLRITSDGRLLVEIGSYLYPSLPQQMREERIARTVPATLYPELRLMGYEECRVAAP